VSSASAQSKCSGSKVNAEPDDVDPKVKVLGEEGGLAAVSAGLAGVGAGLAGVGAGLAATEAHPVRVWVFLFRGLGAVVWTVWTSSAAKGLLEVGAECLLGRVSATVGKLGMS